MSLEAIDQNIGSMKDILVKYRRAFQSQDKLGISKYKKMILDFNKNIRKLIQEEIKRLQLDNG